MLNCARIRRIAVMAVCLCSLAVAASDAKDWEKARRENTVKAYRQFLERRGGEEDVALDILLQESMKNSGFQVASATESDLVVRVSRIRAGVEPGLATLPVTGTSGPMKGTRLGITVMLSEPITLKDRASGELRPSNFAYWTELRFTHRQSGQVVAKNIWGGSVGRVYLGGGSQSLEAISAEADSPANRKARLERLQKALLDAVPGHLQRYFGLKPAR